MTRPLRILIGTFEAGLIPDFAAGFLRAPGHHVTSVLHTLPPSPKNAQSGFPRTTTSLSRRLPRDAFLFQCGGISLIEGNREYWLLQRLRKRIVAAFSGGEVRNIEAYKQQCGLDSVSSELERDCHQRAGHDQYTQIHALRMAERHADVVVDQLYFYYQGELTLEALASGCAVASSSCQTREPFPEKRPIWHIDQQSVKERLGTLLKSKELRLSLAGAGRKFVQDHHGHVAVARRILGRLQSGTGDLCEHPPDFFARFYDPSHRGLMQPLRSGSAPPVSPS